ncbi:glucosaminidase domain-containing protein [Streptococcus hillyeri]|uniref:glucosaminidase domain-containing protein n=1 Tax=Streptococcus hillyeri TaxID=2282420 RepID=UPI0034E1AEE7
MHFNNKARKVSKKDPVSVIMALTLSVLAVCLFAFGKSLTKIAEANEYSVVDYRQQFINSIAGSAQELANANDLYPSVMIAQAIHESNYGLSGLGAFPYHNLFGIKGSYQGQAVQMETWEDDGAGNAYTILSYFRSYPSYHESLQDYVGVVRQDYFSGAWRSNTLSYADATQALTGTYATDTSYVNKLNAIIELHNLTQYDTMQTSNGESSMVAGDLVWNNYRRQYTTQETLDIDHAWAIHIGQAQ